MIEKHEYIRLVNKYEDPVIVLSGLLSGFYFAGSVLMLVYGDYLVSLILWLLSGVASVTLVNWAFTYYEHLHRIIVTASAKKRGTIAPRLNIGRQLATLLSLTASPTAGLLVLVAFIELLNIVNYSYTVSGMSMEDVRKLSSSLKIPDISALAMVSVIPIFLPLLAVKSLKAIPLVSCMVLSIIHGFERVFRDEFYCMDIVDVAVWSNSPGSAIDSKLVAK